MLWLAAFSSKVAHLPTVVAWKVASRKLLWWPDGGLLQRQSRSTVELLLLLLLRLLLELPRFQMWAIALILLLLWSVQLNPKWGIHHVVLGRSTARSTTASRYRHHLFPLLLINLSHDLHHSLLIDGCTRQLIVQQASKLYQALLQVVGQSCTIQIGLLLVRVDVV
jgi:hypothetical protein